MLITENEKGWILEQKVEYITPKSDCKASISANILQYCTLRENKIECISPPKATSHIPIST